MKYSFDDIVDLLKSMISIPSYSREEDKTAVLISDFLRGSGVEPNRLKNNVYTFNRFFKPGNPTLLLNSHHDTVRPDSAWDNDPFNPGEFNERITGLGSNDAGASIVCLLAVFLHFYDKKDLKFNLVYLASAEEEISGKDGVELVLPELGEVHLGIVGEPTGMQMAIAEKGLMVLDCVAKGRSGHAAREEGINAIYKALEDIHWFRTYSFPEKSELLGEVRMTVTLIHSGTQHNVIPDRCTYVVDVRSTEKYSNEDILELISRCVKSEVTARSVRLQSSSISIDHPLVQAARELGLKLFGSSTTSDQALMPFPTVKIGPGESARSHTAGEYITLGELRKGIDIYIKLLEKIIY